MNFGTSYYPELIPEEEWSRDLDRMAKCGLSTIRMLDFAWTKIEAREGVYTLEWLDRFLELVAERNMRVVLCTPTATPPAWLATQFPRIMIERRDGTREPFGSRRHVCVNSPIYRHFSANLAKLLGERYGANPVVIGWQIDNELCGVEHTFPECHCPECNWLFRDWLKKHYKSTTALNQAWGTGFWNQEYSDWGEIETPRNPRTVAGHVIDYQRFFSDSQITFIKIQRDTLREVISQQQWISHNSTGVLDRGISHTDYATALDVAGWDSYFSNPHYNALVHNMFRSSKNKPFIVFETNSDENGSIAFWAEMVARGASSIYFWHYRQHRFNSEQDCQALCDHAGEPFPGRLERITLAIEKLGGFNHPKTIKHADTAIFHDINNTPYHFDRKSPWKDAFASPYLGSIVDAYQPFWQDGVDMDFRNSNESLDEYKLILLPSMQLMDAKFAEKLIEWVSNGGVLMVTGKTAHLNEHGVYYSKRANLLEEMLGFTIIEEDMSDATEVRMDKATFQLEHCWNEKIEIDGTATILANFDNGYPAVLENDYGKGKIFYQACRSTELTRIIGRMAIAASGVSSFPQDNELVGSALSPDGQSRWFFNYGDDEITIDKTTIPAKDFAIKKNSFSIHH